MMIHVKYVLLVLLVASQNIMAQPGFRPGYIIKNNGDSLSGLVYYGCDNRLKNSCRFKRFELIKPVLYKPSEIRAYGFLNGKYFESQKSASKERFVGLEASPNYHEMKKVVFIADFSLLKPVSRLTAGFLIQSEYVIVDIPSEFIIYFREADYDKVYRTGPGFFIEYRLLRKSNVLSAGLSPVFFNGHFHGYASYKTEADCRDEIIMQYKALRLPLYIKACYNRNRIRPFIKAGVFGSWMLSSNYVHFAERQRTDRIYQDWYNDYKMKADIGFLSSAGVRFMIGHARQLEIEIDYKSGNQNLFYTQKDYGFPMDTKINTRVMGLCLSINI